MTKDDAIHLATLAAVRDGRAHDVWQHVGGVTHAGRRVLAQGRCLVRDPSQLGPPPGVWAKVHTVEPNGTPRPERPRADWTPEEVALDATTRLAAHVNAEVLFQIITAMTRAIRDDRAAQASRGRPPEPPVP